MNKTVLKILCYRFNCSAGAAIRNLNTTDANKDLFQLNNILQQSNEEEIEVILGRLPGFIRLGKRLLNNFPTFLEGKKIKHTIPAEIIEIWLEIP